MTTQVLNQIKAAEAQADEIRQKAGLSAKQDLKEAAGKCERLIENAVSKAQLASQKKLKSAKQSIYANIEKQKLQKQAECDELKKVAQKKLETAANLCVEGLL